MLNFLQQYKLAALISVGLLSGSAMRGDMIISVQFQGVNGPVNFQGVEPDAATADPIFASSDQWNHLESDGSINTFPDLLTSTGANSGANLSISVAGGYNDGTHDLPDTYIVEYSTSGSSFPFAISGLAPGEAFTLFLYGYNSVHSANDRGEAFTVGTSTFDTATGNPASLDPTHAVDGVITGTTDSSGAISGSWTLDSTNESGEVDWAGFQLDVSSPAVAAPEPSTGVLLWGGVGLLIFCLRRSQRWC